MLSPGVLGQTGIEASELIKAAVSAVKPAAVIVIDALGREKHRKTFYHGTDMRHRNISGFRGKKQAEGVKLRHSVSTCNSRRRSHCRGGGNSCRGAYRLKKPFL